MKQADMFGAEDEWEPCTCPWGAVVGGKGSDVPPTTGPENCSCEVHRDEWAQQAQERRDEQARAQWKPNRASRAIEQARVARVASGGRSENERELAAALPGPMAALLEIAVPGWIKRLRLLSPAEFEARRAALVDSISGPGSAQLVDPARRVSAKKGEPAANFNVLAETLAALSFQRGGVAWCGMHFESVGLTENEYLRLPKCKCCEWPEATK